MGTTRGLSGRYVLDVGRPDAKARHRVSRVGVGGGESAAAALVVSARAVSGAGGIALTVKYRNAGQGPFDFPRGAKQIGSTYAVPVVIDSAELQAVDELEIGAASQAGASSLVEVLITEERRCGS